MPEGIEGFHCHCHCESNSYELERTLQHIEEKFSRWFPQLKWLNLGGGHLMTRADYDVDYLIRLLQGLKSRYPHLQIILEPVRFHLADWSAGGIGGRCSRKPGDTDSHSGCELYLPHARLSGDALSAAGA